MKLADLQSRGMIIDGIGASEAVDSSAERILISGMDISTLEAGEGVVNYEHLGPDTAKNKKDKKEDKETRVPYGDEVVGRIIFAKKILKEENCDSERELFYWNKIKLPFIYLIARLYDGSGHPGAQALAAQIRDHHIHGEKILVRFSIEGATVSRNKDEKNIIEHSIAKKVALTITPANKTCDIGIIKDPNAPTSFYEDKKDTIYQLLGKAEVEYTQFPLQNIALRNNIKTLLKAKILKKAITAGSYNAAPGTLTGGAAMQKEDLKGKVVKNPKQRIMEFWKNYDKTQYSKDSFRKTIGEHLPDVDPKFLDQFADVVDKIRFKKPVKVARNAILRKMEYLQVELKKADVALPKPSSPDAVTNVGRLKGGMPAPVAPKTPALVNSQLHGTPHNNDAQNAMVHGMNVSNLKPHSGLKGHTSNVGIVDHNDKKLFVKPHPKQFSPGEGVTDPEREVVTHNLARDYFKVGEHFPATAAFKHPETGDIHSAQEWVKDAEHYDENNEKHGQILNKLGTSGQLDKLAMIDRVLGNPDRHGGNFVFSGNNVHMIDNGLNFHNVPSETNDLPLRNGPLHAWNESGKKVGQDDIWNQPVNPQAKAWAMGLVPNDFRNYLKNHNLPDSLVDRHTQRLVDLQNELKSGNDSRHSLFNRTLLGKEIKSPASDGGKTEGR